MHASKGIHCRHHQKSKTGVLVAPQKRTDVFLFLKENKIVCTFPARVSVVGVPLGARLASAHLRGASHSLTAETDRLARQVVRALAASSAPIYNQKFHEING